MGSRLVGRQAGPVRSTSPLQQASSRRRKIARGSGTLLAEAGLPDRRDLLLGRLGHLESVGLGQAREDVPRLEREGQLGPWPESRIMPGIGSPRSARCRATSQTSAVARRSAVSGSNASAIELERAGGGAFPGSRRPGVGRGRPWRPGGPRAASWWDGGPSSGPPGPGRGVRPSGSPRPDG